MASRHSRAPAEQTNGRTTEQVALRMQPDAALRLRAAADASGRTMSDYVASLVDGRAHRAELDSPESRGDALAEISRLANAIYNHVRLLELARGELGRAHGGVKHLFETATPAAEAHKYELAQAARSLRDAIARADQTIESANEAYGPLRLELAACAKRLVRIG